MKTLRAQFIICERRRRCQFDPSQPGRAQEEEIDASTESNLIELLIEHCPKKSLSLTVRGGREAKMKTKNKKSHSKESSEMWNQNCRLSTRERQLSKVRDLAMSIFIRYIKYKKNNRLDF